jgi:hypothetical protein
VLEYWAPRFGGPGQAVSEDGAVPSDGVPGPRAFGRGGRARRTVDRSRRGSAGSEAVRPQQTLRGRGSGRLHGLVLGRAFGKAMASTGPFPYPSIGRARGRGQRWSVGCRAGIHNPTFRDTSSTTTI